MIGNARWMLTSVCCLCLFAGDVARADWTRAYLHLFPEEKQEILSFFLDRFDALQQAYGKLRKSVVHNDANDHNILVSNQLIDPDVVALIDFGDAIYTQLINDAMLPLFENKVITNRRKSYLPGRAVRRGLERGAPLSPP